MRTSSIAVFAAAALSLLATACSPLSSGSAAAPAASIPVASGGAASRGAASPADPLASLSAAAVTQKALADLRATPAVHVSGTFTDSGTTVTLNLTAGATTCAGTISQVGSGSFQLLISGGTVWIKPDAQFWTKAGGASPSELSVLEGKYLQTTTKDSSFSTLTELCQPTRLAGLFGKLPGLVKGQVTEISGQRALPLKDTGDSGVIDVSDTAVPEILRLGLTSAQHLDFTGYGTPATVTPPPAGATLSGSKYGF